MKTMKMRGGKGSMRAILAGLLLAAVSAQAGEMCAEVQIEIEQELALERQAFDANMKIHNGLTTLPMRNVKVTLTFQDVSGNAVAATTDANNTNALFYVRQDSMTGITSVSGAGSVTAASSADVHWLIIPAAGAGGSGLGVRYLVGATLSYTLGDDAQTIDVTPDVITVTPMPKLKLDYFLPDHVYGDDAFTEGVEPPEPFTLGVRVKNSGCGAARNVSLSSGQPKIVDNDRGLQVGFQITGAEVNGAAAAKTLTVVFGDIAAGTAAMGRWIMECTLSGRCTSFEASFAHSDDLGGRLTSLIESVATHTLARMVRLDSPGSDARDDFLAFDDLAMNLYGSDGTDAAVQNLSALATLAAAAAKRSAATQTVYTLTLPGVSGLYYAEQEFEAGSGLEVAGAMRWDGKTIKTNNVWISRKRPESGTGWTYYLNLFDSGAGGTYTVTFGPRAVAANEAPVLQYIGRRVGFEGEDIGFSVRATDMNGTIPELSALGVPEGATFTPGTNGTATFFWTPATAQAGEHPMRFTASDGEFTDWEIVKLYVGRPGETLNANGIPESLTAWKPTITNLEAVTSSGNATVQWESVEGIPYEVYWNSNPFERGSSWTRTAQVLGAGGLAAVQDSSLGEEKRRYYQVALYGDDPTDQDVWGVIRQDMRAAGYTLVSLPLRTDRRFDGEMGFDLAEELTGHDGGVGSGAAEVFLLQENGSWRTLYLDAQGVWREADGTASTYELPAGQGLWVANKSGSDACATFTGPVGNDGTESVTLQTGFNLIGLSEGKDLPLAATLAAADPQGGASEETADELVIQEADGSWRWLMFVTDWGAPFDGNWFDFSTYQIVPTNAVLEPGAAYYYLRRGGETELEF